MVHPLQLAKVISQVSIDKLRIAMRRLSADSVLGINGSCILDLRPFSCTFSGFFHLKGLSSHVFFWVLPSGRTF